MQAIILPTTDRQPDYARSVQKQLDAAGIRATLDERNERVNSKIREAQLQKIPFMLVVGDSRTGERPGLGAQSQAGRSGHKDCSGIPGDDSRAHQDEGGDGVVARADYFCPKKGAAVLADSDWSISPMNAL